MTVIHKTGDLYQQIDFWSFIEKMSQPEIFCSTAWWWINCCISYTKNFVPKEQIFKSFLGMHIGTKEVVSWRKKRKILVTCCSWSATLSLRLWPWTPIEKSGLIILYAATSYCTSLVTLYECGIWPYFLRLSWCSFVSTCSLSLWRVAQGSKHMFLELIHGLFIT